VIDSLVGPGGMPYARWHAFLGFACGGEVYIKCAFID